MDAEKAYNVEKERIENLRDKDLESYDDKIKAAEKYYDKMERMLDSHNDDIINYKTLIKAIPIEWQQANKDSMKAIQDMTIQSEKLIDKLNQVKKLSNNLSYSPRTITVPGFSDGGIVNYTGLAMVHGTPEVPEWILNNDQMKRLISNMMSAKGNIKSGDTITNVHVDKIVTPSVNDFMIQLNNLVKVT